MGKSLKDGVPCARHANISFISKANTVPSFKVHPGLTCWWPSTQIISEGEAKSWHPKSNVGTKVRPLQMLKYRPGFITIPGKLEKSNFTGARRVKRMKQKFWPERRGMKNKSTRLRNYIACGSHPLCFLLHMQRGCRIRFPNPNALGLIL